MTSSPFACLPMVVFPSPATTHLLLFSLYRARLFLFHCRLLIYIAGAEAKVLFSAFNNKPQWKTIPKPQRCPGLGLSIPTGRPRGWPGTIHWLKRRISLSKSLLGFCPRCAPFVGSQVGTQRLQSYSLRDQAFAVGYGRVDYNSL